MSKSILALKDFAEISSSRIHLRILKPGDVSQQYLSWFEDEDVRQFIEYSESNPTYSDLTQYVADCYSAPDTIFWGIFCKDSGMHIGNIKYSPINRVENCATMGILIGEKSWRGRGVAREVISLSSQWLCKNVAIKTILLGVLKSNKPAVASYKRLGFNITADSGESLTMSWSIKGG